MSPSRSAVRLLAGCLAVVSLAGCGFRGAASLPLPGGQGNGADAYDLTIEFTDVLDLVVQSAVKVNDVTVGSVQDIEATGYTARVVVSINPDIVLPANSRASLRQTSLLGEKFVSLDAPAASEGVGRLRGGETIGLDRTVRSAEIEEVLSALSLVLNGGSLEQLQVINKELIAALDGREDRVKDLLGNLDVFVGSLDDQKGQIVRALDSLDRLSTNLLDDRDVIATALEDIPAGLAVLTDQREELTTLLTSLDDLGDVAVRVIEASKDNTVADLNALRPILTQLNAAGTALPKSLELLTTYPFPRTVTQGIKGDYANLFVTIEANAADLQRVLPLPPPPPAATPSLIPSPVPSPSLSVPSIRPGLPLPGLQSPAPLPVPGGVPLPSLSPLPSPSLPGGLPVAPAPPLLGRDGFGLLKLLIGGLA